MPIAYIKDIEPHTRLGVWKIDEMEHLDGLCPPTVCSSWLREKCEARRKETFAVYALLHELTGRRDLIIAHKPSGKPFLQTLDGCTCQCQISVSHTHGYASVIISSKRSVAIDIEYYSDRIMRIARRFLRPDEMDDIVHADNALGNNAALTRLLIYWCAKETIYKLYSDEALTFQNIRVNRIAEIESEGQTVCHNLILSETRVCHYTQNTEYVMTYC